jgi:peptide/nickel transport system ATP-binding protein
MALLSVENLSVTYKTRSGRLPAVDNVSFSVDRGASLGIVGESGCGKTTLGMALMRLLASNARVTQGVIRFDGIDLTRLSDEEMQKIRWKRIAMIFQAAMNALNPVQRVGEQIIEAIRAHDPQISKKEARKAVSRLYADVGIEESRIYDFPHEYSGGMKQRAIIAMALSCAPELIIADEPTTALDVIVQDQIIRKLKAIQHEHNISIVFISHDIGVVAEVCHYIAVMYKGRIVETGRREEVFGTPLHPYTRSLLSSYLTIDGRMELTPYGDLPGFSVTENGKEAVCEFVPHCEKAESGCSEDPLQWHHATQTHKVLCRVWS